MSDPRVVGAKYVLQKLFPGANVLERSLSSNDFKARHKSHTHNDRLNSGTILDGGTVYLWQRYPNGQVLEFEINRSPIELSKRECAILWAFEKTQRGLFSSDDSRAAETTSRIASYGSFGNILISRFLRSHHASNFWTPNLVLSELQALSLQSYEGSSCTSGVLFVSEPTAVLRKLNTKIYQFEEIDVDHRFDVGFFDLPPTFRYVDGKNAFYVVDNARRIRGILRLRNPTAYSIYDRASYKHLDSIFSIPAGRMFVASVGNYRSVTVQSRNRLQLRWQHQFWSATDKDLIVETFQSFGLDDETSEGLTCCLLAISDMRFGALVLIALDANRRPSAAGDIGNSGISSTLKQLSRGKRFNDLVKSNEALGILTSDGLTTIGRSGMVLGAGDIINLQSSNKNISGGGRTQAAISASSFGLAVKVSEDGPISIFKDGALQIRFIR